MDPMHVDDPLYARWLARAPVYDSVFSCLSPRSLVRLAQTCRVAYSAVASFKSRAFNVNRHFSRFFDHPLAFRSLQAKTNTVVSGSNALQFLDRSFYPESDLDVYTHPGHSFEVAQFLVETEGYRFSPREDSDSEEQPEQNWEDAIGNNWDGTERRIIRPLGREEGYPMTGINGVWTFRKLDVNADALTVQIIESASCPLEAILCFHTSCVMNLITADAAYSLYPIATFEARCALGMPNSRCSPAAIQKYIQRGWRIYFSPTPYEIEHSTIPPFFLDRVRWVGDGLTWVLPLDQTGVRARPPLSPASAPLTFDPILLNGWRLRPTFGLPPSGFETHYYPLQTTLFRYNYAFPEEQLTFSVRHWAHQQGKYTHGQVSKENWVWFDADLPSFLKKD